MSALPGRRWLWLLPVLAALAAYAIAPRGDLVWDDQVMVQQQMPAIRTYADVLLPPAGIPQWSYAYFRPMTILSYVIDMQLFGLGNAAGAHAANVVYHALTTLFLLLLLRRLLRHLPNGELGAIAAATLFAVHPIHTESVSWITGRSDLLATLFVLPALHLALRWRDRGSIGTLLISAVLLLAGMLAKEVTLAGLLILPVLWLNRPRAATGNSVRRGWLRPAAVTAAWLGATLVYLWLRRGSGTPGGTWTEAGADWLALPLRAAGWYLTKLVVPWPQSVFVVWEMVPGVAVASLVVAVAATGSLLLARRWATTGDGTLFAGAWWFGVSLAPSLAVTLAGVSETPLAERYLYLPSAGAALLAGEVLCHLSVTRAARVGWAVTAVLSAGWLVATLQRGEEWLSDLRLWTATVAHAPGYALPWIELGKAQFNAGDDGTAMRSFERALALSRTPKLEAIARYNIGTLQAVRGDYAVAEEAFRASLRASATYDRAHFGLGRAIYEQVIGPQQSLPPEARMRRLDEAIAALDEAARLTPSFADAWLARAQAETARADILRDRGDTANALASYQAAADSLVRAARLNPAGLQRPIMAELAQLVEYRLQTLSAE
jgi:tetratricopeptide (TPR) repeat protein